jgi:hypothetical protein
MRKNDHCARDGRHHLRLDIFLDKSQREIYPRRNSAGSVDVPISRKNQAGVDVDGGKIRRKQIGVHPVCRRAALMQETRGRQNECAGAYRGDPPYASR